MAHWIITNNRYYECSSCESTFDHYFYRMDNKTECPFCGEMIEENKNEQVSKV